MRTRHITILIQLAFAACIGLALPYAAHAQAIKLEVGIGAASQVTAPYLANYIVMVYQFIVGSIGVVATVMIMFNGMRWVTAGGNSENIGVARDGIISAVVGLLIALMSYILLNAINPALVGFRELDQAELDFEAVTESPEALNSGNIGDDPALTNYTTALPADLKAYLSNNASQPYITAETFTALQAALTELRDDSKYQGMKLTINDANRSLDTQTRLYACFKTKKDGHPCPTGCGKCSTAAYPGTSNHGFGKALDVTWSNTGSGKYVSTGGYANSDWEKSCMVKKTGSDCTTALRDSVTAMNTMMQSAGFQHLCVEWWHHQPSGNGLCPAGTYQ